MRSPGAACSSTEVKTSAACAVPVFPITAVRSSTSASGPRPSDRATARVARACTPQTITWVSASAATSAALQASAKAAWATGTYACSPKRSSQTWAARSPGSRHRSRSSIVAVPHPSTREIVGAVGCEQQRRGTIAAVALVAAPWQTGPDVGRHDERGLGRIRGEPERARAERVAPPTSYAPTAASRPSAAWIAVAFVFSRYAGPAVANRRRRGSSAPPTSASAVRAASTASVVESSS